MRKASSTATSSPRTSSSARDGLVKLLDFGLAKVPWAAAGAEAPTCGPPSRTGGLVLGTVPYMSPEQRRGEPASTPGSDVFSLGVAPLRAPRGPPSLRRTERGRDGLAHPDHGAAGAPPRGRERSGGDGGDRPPRAPQGAGGALGDRSHGRRARIGAGRARLPVAARARRRPDALPPRAFRAPRACRRRRQAGALLWLRHSRPAGPRRPSSAACLATWAGRPKRSTSARADAANSP